MMKRILKIKIDIYDSLVTVIYTKDVLKYNNKIIKDNKLELVEEEIDSNIFASFLHDPNSIGYYWLILPQVPSINDIVHEASHATIKILHDHGINIDHENSEPFAYLNGYLVERIFNRK